MRLALLTLCAVSAFGQDSVANLIQSGNRKAALDRIRTGADVNAPQPDGTRALHWAVYKIDYELVDTLLAKKAAVNVKNEFGSAPLAEAVKLAEVGAKRQRARLAAAGSFTSGNLVGDLVARFDIHMGTPEEVATSLLADDTLKRATDMTIQSHSIDPPHPYILRSIELMAEKVAPALGWAPERDSGERRVA